MRHATSTSARTGTSMALLSMVLVQSGLAVSVGLIGPLGPEGVAWLRLVWAAAIMVIVVRPRLSALDRRSLGYGALLGLATAGVTLLFMAAVARLPLGTASALEFLGPLGVALAHGRGRGRAWAALAAVGVVCLTEPWSGSVDALGCAYALGAAACWAAYIVLTQKVGDRLAGFQGLAVSMPVAAVAATVIAGPETFARLTPELAWQGLGLALLLPVAPFMLELLALRRLTTAAFGTLMALEPGFALVIGVLALHQAPRLLAVLGVGMVVAAGIGAERTGARDRQPGEVPVDVSPEVGRTT